MKIKLTKSHLDFFNKHLKKEKPNLYEYLQSHVISAIIEIRNKDKEIELSDWLGEQLQIIGFENNQENLNNEGKIIDDLIEKFNY